ncbi:hypothetical protein [Alicyclobacillus sendaiensis]|uniref:hypothetical protein n=1 Tax=Alicyclobacillus sendaiensis TaxID=192387 RepID=UPI000B278BE8|nr:hypothetical protein [Alicyclobacillus sendaiensis]
MIREHGRQVPRKRRLPFFTWSPQHAKLAPVLELNANPKPNSPTNPAPYPVFV